MQSFYSGGSEDATILLRNKRETLLGSSPDRHPHPHVTNEIFHLKFFYIFHIVDQSKQSVCTCLQLKPPQWYQFHFLKGALSADLLEL